MVKVGSCSAAWNSKHLSDLHVCESFDIVKDNYGPRSFRELRQRVSQARLQLCVYCGVPKRRAKRITQFFGRPDFPATCYIESGVRHDPIYPRPETLGWIEPFHRLPGLDEAFLNRVFGILVNRYDCPCNEVRTPLVRTNQRRESGLVACTR